MLLPMAPAPQMLHPKLFLSRSFPYHGPASWRGRESAEAASTSNWKNFLLAWCFSPVFPATNLPLKTLFSPWASIFKKSQKLFCFSFCPWPPWSKWDVESATCLNGETNKNNFDNSDTRQKMYVKGVKQPAAGKKVGPFRQEWKGEKPSQEWRRRHLVLWNEPKAWVFHFRVWR